MTLSVSITSEISFACTLPVPDSSMYFGLLPRKPTIDLTASFEWFQHLPHEPSIHAMSSFVIFDLETTGLSPDADDIIQIAATRFAHGKLLSKDSFFSYCCPRFGISDFISRYTGIKNSDVRDAPKPIEVIQEFSRFVGDSVLMAHNGHRFDIKFLKSTCNRHGAKTRSIQSIDTITISRRAYGPCVGIGHSLDAVMNRTGIDPSKYKRHDARGDILALGHAVEVMWKRLKLDEHAAGIPRLETTSLPASLATKR